MWKMRHEMRRAKSSPWKEVAPLWNVDFPCLVRAQIQVSPRQVSSSLTHQSVSSKEVKYKEFTKCSLAKHTFPLATAHNFGTKKVSTFRYVRGVESRLQSLELLRTHARVRQEVFCKLQRGSERVTNETSWRQEAKTKEICKPADMPLPPSRQELIYFAVATLC